MPDPTSGAPLKPSFGLCGTNSGPYCAGGASSSRLSLDALGFGTVSECSSRKVSVVSAGITMSLLPVNAAPAVPAPAPTRPPMSAPLPPPARPPISAPAPPPPAINPAERFPLPFSARSTVLEAIWYVVPNARTESSRTDSDAPPLNLPSGFASTTVPLAEEPALMTVTPPTTTGSATVAVNRSPGVLTFDPIAEVVVTAMCVPAGITIGGGGGGG